MLEENIIFKMEERENFDGWMNKSLTGAESILEVEKSIPLAFVISDDELNPESFHDMNSRDKQVKLEMKPCVAKEFLMSDEDSEFDVFETTDNLSESFHDKNSRDKQVKLEMKQCVAKEFLLSDLDSELDVFETTDNLSADLDVSDDENVSQRNEKGKGSEREKIRPSIPAEFAMSDSECEDLFMPTATSAMLLEVKTPESNKNEFLNLVESIQFLPDEEIQSPSPAVLDTFYGHESSPTNLMNNNSCKGHHNLTDSKNEPEDILIEATRSKGKYSSKDLQMFVIGSSESSSDDMAESMESKGDCSSASESHTSTSDDCSLSEYTEHPNSLASQKSNRTVSLTDLAKADEDDTCLNRSLKSTSLPDLSTPENMPNKTKRQSTYWSCAANNEDTESDDDFESYLWSLKKSAKPPADTPRRDFKRLKNNSLDDFIVPDDASDLDSEGEDDDLYVTAIQTRLSFTDGSPVCSSTKGKRAEREKRKQDEETFTFKTPKSHIKKPVDKVLKPSSSLRKPSHTSEPRLSFLKSLSNNVAEHIKHPDAVRYKNFQKSKEELTSKLFHLYNDTVFDNQLPENLNIKWNSRLLKTAGYCAYKKIKVNEERSCRIELSVKVCDSAERLRDTLIHEMCHAAVWLIHGLKEGHGTYWKLFARKANRIHPELPIIMRCHNYEIFCKFVYKCSRCQNQIGRHSKSMDTTKTVCGLCKAPFVLYTNSKNHGLTPHKARTPKTPAFAQFVKEHYSSLKKPGSAHKDIMKQLGVDFKTKLSL